MEHHLHPTINYTFCVGWLYTFNAKHTILRKFQTTWRSYRQTHIYKNEIKQKVIYFASHQNISQSFNFHIYSSLYSSPIMVFDHAIFSKYKYIHYVHKEFEKKNYILSPPYIFVYACNIKFKHNTFNKYIYRCFERFVCAAIKTCFVKFHWEKLRWLFFFVRIRLYL